MPRTTEELLNDAEDLLTIFPAAAGGKIILLVAEMAVKLREREAKEKRLHQIIEEMQRSNDRVDSFRYMAEGLRKHGKATPPKKET